MEMSRTAHLQKFEVAMNIALLKDAHTLEACLFINSYRPFIKCHSVHTKMLRGELLSGEVQPRVGKGQAHTLAGEIWAHAQANSQRLVLGIDTGFATIPGLSRGPVAKETNQLSVFVSYSVIWAAPLQKFIQGRVVVGVPFYILEFIRLL